MKKLLKRIIPILIALPFILYIAIVVTNNNLATKVYDTSNLTYYCITDWGSKLNYDNELLFEFLNFDLRGH